MTNSSFRQMHQPGNPFVLANVWDIGSAKIMASLGAKALASTSGGHAFVLGVKDMGDISRDQSLAHCRDLVGATSLPVSGDLENGYGHSPDDVARTVLLAAEAGLAGCCIEDTMLPDTQPYEFAKAVERIEAGVNVARSFEGDFVLTARADGLLTGHYSLKEAIRRLQAFEAVGADVLYAPMPASSEDLATICKSVKAPVNALASGKFARMNLAQFAELGVARVSLGSAFSRMVHTAMLNGARQILAEGDFSAFENAASLAVFEDLFDQVP